MNPLTKIYWLRFALGLTAAFICIGYGLVTGTISTNLVPNRSLEMGEISPQDWFSSGTGVQWSTTARTGSRSLRINVTNADAECNSAVRPVQEENTYQVFGFFKGEVTADQRFFLTIKWFSDLEGHSLKAENNTSIPAGNYTRWTLIGGEYSALKGTKSCQTVFRAVNGSGDLYGDDFEVRQTESLTKFMNGLTLAIITYFISYYIIKFSFMHKVEKPRKLFTTGIGIYFLTWIVFWASLYTLIGAYL